MRGALKLFILGLGYTGGRIADAARRAGWEVDGIGHTAFENAGAAIGRATHILSSVPPGEDGDPVLRAYAEAIQGSGAAWIGYLSSTGVYGDAKGAWVDESSPVGVGRRSARIAADLGWQALDPRVHVFRLPGIYGPGRSPLDRMPTFRVDAPEHRFSRIHVEDIAGAILASMQAPCPGIYNLADDRPATSAEVTAYAARLMGHESPPLVSLDAAPLSDAARGFYSERRRVVAAKIGRVLGYRLQHPDYQAGLRAIYDSRRR